MSSNNSFPTYATVVRGRHVAIRPEYHEGCYLAQMFVAWRRISCWFHFASRSAASAFVISTPDAFRWVANYDPRGEGGNGCNGPLQRADYVFFPYCTI